VEGESRGPCTLTPADTDGISHFQRLDIRCLRWGIVFLFLYISSRSIQGVEDVWRGDLRVQHVGIVDLDGQRRVVWQFQYAARRRR
jgi:hypothetical protein